MRFHWIVPSFSTVFLLSTPAEAANLQSWRFDANANRLYITTDAGVQPRAQLMGNPTRLVIDLPGIRLNRLPVNQPVGGAISSVRVGQFDPQTTRLVIELSPGYTLDPQKILFRGATANQWTVQLPTPQPVADASSLSPLENTEQALAQETTADMAGALTRLENVRATPDGLFIRTSGQQPDIQVQRSRDRATVSIDLPGTAVNPQVQGLDLAVNSNGIAQVQVSQIQSSPPVARVTLNVTNTSADWQATATNLGGVIVLPKDSGAGGGSTFASQPQSYGRQSDTQLATIESVELVGGSQLLIKTDGPFTYTSDWDPSSSFYEIRIPSARLGQRVRTPRTNFRTLVSKVGVKQADAQTVVIQVQPASWAQITQINQPGSQMLVLQLQPAGSVSQPAPTTNYPSSDSPRIPSGRVVVVVDPGHGGRDVGAVGIGGLQEADIVMDISRQVAALLEQQGVQAVLTRQDDREIELEPRVQMADRVNANLFVSIHANSIDMSRPDVNGIETYYYASGERLARTIHNSLLQATGARDRRVRQARFYVLRKTSMPAVLLELGFVTGAEDAPRLANSAYRQRLAEAITQGILQYIQQNR
ncbi:MAG: N-acetylmuramoyl-L-alanine amidase [Oscillatoria princeps RMCB-10]|nr:N-acetylmuramoyl-L-alanine amidase [Oscillatoria princeps RMCB-10]